MTHDFNKVFLNIDGIPTETKMNETLATHLARETQGNVVKLMDWVRSLMSSGTMETDRADAQWLKKFIENHPQLYIFVKEQLMACINETTP